MQYISTRGEASGLNFADVLMAGLARDGGLYIPEHWPRIDTKQWLELRKADYNTLASQLMLPFAQPSMNAESLQRLIDDAYQTFRHHSVAPLVQIGKNEWIMELFHGPTLAFKDVAMQLLARLYDHVLQQQGGHITVVGATSGDTGSAAIEAFRACKHASIFIMHPHGRTSEVQRRQMTTVIEPNVHNIAIEGTFDDCQALLKGMFNHHAFRDEIRLSGVNSINWARILPQMVYYAAASLALGGPERYIRFSVPTGNFGDIFAGYVAKQLGLPIEQLLIATNINDILTRALTTGQHTLGDVMPTFSPSMDIQVSSNFERLLFEASNRDSSAICSLMQQLQNDRTFQIDPAMLTTIKQNFAAHRADEQQTLQTIREVYKQTGMLIDPHTAVGVYAARATHNESHADIPTVTLATAHPAKFPDAVEQATGIRPPLPEHLADLYGRKEAMTILPNDLSKVEDFIRARAFEH